MTETEELLSDWKATYGELFPGRDPDAMLYTDSQLALALLMRRELRAGLTTTPLANATIRTLVRRAAYNPKDPE